MIHTASTTKTRTRRKRIRLTIQGTVQGIGFRPFVYRLAQQLSLGGWISNAAEGVVLEVEGTHSALARFQNNLRAQAPLACDFREVTVVSIPIENTHGFSIRPNQPDGQRRSSISPDMATCQDCLQEINDPGSRRYRYPFTTCTHCGPRYSIVTDLPYDRRNTTMQAFPLCHDCRTEYKDIANRRFHAEALACPRCGPHVTLWDSQGKILCHREQALIQACTIVRHGHILAVKGLGGFQLWVDAVSHKAVTTLRLRKHRPRKPFAILFPSLFSLREHCLVSPEEEALLTSPEAPIVLVKRNPLSSITPLVAPDNPYVGAMLPYTPLHHLLMADLQIPLVATSANQSDEPMVVAEHTAGTRLQGMADAFLVHNRAIARPVDDSLVRVVNGQRTLLRRARGYVPRPLSLNIPEEICQRLSPILAVGGHLKNTVAVTTQEQVLVSQHIGDLSTQNIYSQFEQTVADQLRLINVQPQAIACDMHPDYRSTVFAQQLGKQLQIPVMTIQHHHAHIVSCMIEHHLTEPVLGVAWDGAGYGSDGTIWGGEFLFCNYSGFKRSAHLRPFRLPGGEACMREPRRVALSLLYEVFGKEALELDLPPLHSLGSSLAQSLVSLLEQDVRCPSTTSMGRVFDGMSSILGLRHISTFEGEAALALEFESEKSFRAKEELGFSPSLPIFTERGEALCIDWRPYVQQTVQKYLQGDRVPEIAKAFHQYLTDIIVQVAQKVGNSTIVLSGGVFQNATLQHLVFSQLSSHGFHVYTNRDSPANDGGLSLGQAIIGSTVHALLLKGSCDV